MRIISFLLALFNVILIAHYPLIGQQLADTSFDFVIQKPEYTKGKGPVISLDEAHFNFHTLDGRYAPFGKLLEKDGYILKSGQEKFSPSSLASTKILVIANALADNGEWKLPAKSAFTQEEIDAVHNWVKNGGSLLLIADHMPFAGVASKLALSFGFNFIDGFAIRKDKCIEIFSRELNTLNANAITNGRNVTERIDSIMMFTGQAFIAPPEANKITTLNDDYEVLLPTVAWEFSEGTPRISGQGLVNGAYLEYGKGRLVIMGEAAMFSAQISGPQKNKAGMNHSHAVQNLQFLLNIIHWLDNRY